MEIHEIYPSFNIDIDGIVEVLNKFEYKSVLLQLPEGLKRGAPHMIEILENRTPCSIVLDGDPCFGACDHSGDRARALGLDALIHLGHSDIPSMPRGDSMPIHYFIVGMVVKDDILEKGIKELLPGLTGNRIGLATTVQHISLLDKVAGELKGAGKEVLIGDPGKREAFPGQVLGCSFQSARSIASGVDAFVYIGTGHFHPMGLFLSVRSDVFCLDPMTGRISVFEKGEMDRFLRIRYALINKASELMKEGRGVGVIICQKPGQNRKALAESISEILTSRNIDNTLVLMDHISPMKIRALNFSVAVSTACPRIAIDDHISYSDEGVTILTPIELQIALGNARIEDYYLDEEW